MHNKTKRVDGVDLWPHSFAYVGDESDTNSWKFPIHFPGDPAKTKNHIGNALRRFDLVKDIPHGQRADTFLLICGAAMALGLRVGEDKEDSLECPASV